MTKRSKQPDRPLGSRHLVLQYLLANVGNVLTSDEIRAASGGKSEWARRLRELRDEYGYRILSHRDRGDLKPGQYVLVSETPGPVFSRAISKEVRAQVLERNGFTCQMCGASAGDPDPFGRTRKTRLMIGHIVDKSKGGSDTLGNLRAMCEACNEGIQNISLPKPGYVQLLTHVRRATLDDQQRLFEWLKVKLSGRTTSKDR